MHHKGILEGLGRIILRILSIHSKKCLLLIFRITIETTKAFADSFQNIILVGTVVLPMQKVGLLFLFSLLTGSKWDTRAKLEISLYKVEQI